MLTNEKFNETPFLVIYDTRSRNLKMFIRTPRHVESVVKYVLSTIV